MIITITSTPSTADGTFSVLAMDGVELCVTVELPWKDNIPQKSCIPNGTYHFYTYRSPTKGRCWRSDDVPNRTAIEIHSANLASELLGCIAPGSHVADFDGVKGVKDSHNTMLMLYEKLPNDFSLVVQRAPGEGLLPDSGVS